MAATVLDRTRRAAVSQWRGPPTATVPVLSVEDHAHRALDNLAENFIEFLMAPSQLYEPPGKPVHSRGIVQADAYAGWGGVYASVRFTEAAC